MGTYPSSDAIESSMAMKFGWQRLHAEYAKQFGIETPDGPSQKRRTK
jgi:hypothetical protein